MLSKGEEQPNSDTGKETSEAMTDEQSKLPDLVMPKSMKEGETEMEQEEELLKPLPKPSLKPQAYSRTHFDKTKIKTDAAIQHEQQRQGAERLLEQDTEPELTMKEMENIARKEEVRLRRAERCERRMKEKEDENVSEDLAVQEGETSSVGSSGSRER